MATVVGLPKDESGFVGIMPSMLINEQTLIVKGTRLSDNQLVYKVVIERIGDCSIGFDSTGKSTKIDICPPGIDPIVLYVWSRKVADSFACVLFSHLEKNNI